MALNATLPSPVHCTLYCVIYLLEHPHRCIWTALVSSLAVVQCVQSRSLHMPQTLMWRSPCNRKELWLQISESITILWCDSLFKFCIELWGCIVNLLSFAAFAMDYDMKSSCGRITHNFYNWYNHFFGFILLFQFYMLQSVTVPWLFSS